jgi:hypothetical protein
LDCFQAYSTLYVITFTCDYSIISVGFWRWCVGIERIVPSLSDLGLINGLLDPQTFGRTPWFGDQSNARPLPKHRITQHRNTQTHIHALSRIRICNLNVQAVVDSTYLRPLGYWDRLL